MVARAVETETQKQPKVKNCRFCDELVRFVEVTIGKRQDRQTHVLPIDAEPHDGGRVVERDGVFRLLQGGKAAQPNEATFRLHGASNCGPSSRAARR